MARYRIRPDKVSHQDIEGEVIAIHFETGAYYSLTGAAAGVWVALGGDAEEDDLLASFADPPAGARDALRKLLANLMSEGLIIQVPAEEPAKRSPAASIPWEAPRFEKYTDLADLLLADPIHEIDESGWPNVKRPATPER